MSMDSGSTYGEILAPRWRQSLASGHNAQSQLDRNAASARDAVEVASIQPDRLPFGLSLPSANSGQDASHPRNSGRPRRYSVSSSIGFALTQLGSQAQKAYADPITPVRLASHLSVLAIAALILILSQIDIPTWEVSLRLLPSGTRAANSAGNGVGSRVSIFTSGPSAVPLASHESLQRSAIPFTIVREEPQQEIRLYTVQPGDTVLGIAERFGLRPETIQWSNPSLERNVDLIRPGDQLVILPIDGAVHIVAPGDTLSSLAAKYKVSVEDIVGYPANGIEDATAALSVGQQLVIPGGTKPYVPQRVFAYNGSVPANAKFGTGAFVWPTSGTITQRFWSGHSGVDIGSWTGAPVKAADSGYVALAATGWNTGYGNYVIIDHGNGFISLYAHLTSIYVRGGESVSRGQQIGSVGSTGNSTGPHLHFEIRYQGVPRNPMGYLP